MEELADVHEVIAVLLAAEEITDRQVAVSCGSCITGSGNSSRDEPQP